MLTIVSVADVERLWYDFLPFDDDLAQFTCGLAYFIEHVRIFVFPVRNDKDIDSRCSDVSSCIVWNGDYLLRRNEFICHDKICAAFYT